MLALVLLAVLAIADANRVIVTFHSRQPRQSIEEQIRQVTIPQLNRTLDSIGCGWSFPDRVIDATAYTSTVLLEAASGECATQLHTQLASVMGSRVQSVRLDRWHSWHTLNANNTSRPVRPPINFAEQQEHGRRLLQEEGKIQVTDLYGAVPGLYEWHANGISGRGVKVAVLDTGINCKHPWFNEGTLRSCLDFTGEHEQNDRIGHGTAVTSILASSGGRGVAPDAEIYSLRVFSSNYRSRTSYLIDALDHAMNLAVDVINFSIGGPDFLDDLFVNKVHQVVSSGIVMVSAVGNEGPVAGTVLNPADQSEVIAVGCSTSDGRLAEFSSRGMTLWEANIGTGRVKPDFLAMASFIQAAHIDGSQFTVAGTSFAAPIITGLVALLLSHPRSSSFVTGERRLSFTRGLLAMASRHLVDELGVEYSMYDQGHGQVDAAALLDLLSGPEVVLQRAASSPQLVPPSVEMGVPQPQQQCSYDWPLCAQPLYVNILPRYINFTVIAPFHSGRITSVETRLKTPVADQDHTCARPVCQASAGGQVVANAAHVFCWPVVSCNARKDIDPTILDFDIHIHMTEGVSATGFIRLHLPVAESEDEEVPVQKRIVWYQAANIHYPFAYYPRDDLDNSNSETDSLGDHPYTNFRGLFQALLREGYVVETLYSKWCELDERTRDVYSAVLIVDPEDDIPECDIAALLRDMHRRKLVVFAAVDWYNRERVNSISYEDRFARRNVARFGGSNVVSVNRLLDKCGLVIGPSVIRGTFYSTESTFLNGTANSFYVASGGIVGKSASREQLDRSPQSGSGIRMLACAETRSIQDISSPNSESTDSGSSSLPWVDFRKRGRTTSGPRHHDSTIDGAAVRCVSAESTRCISPASNGTSAGTLSNGSKLVVLADSTCLDDSGYILKDCTDFLLDNIY